MRVRFLDYLWSRMRVNTRLCMELYEIKYYIAYGPV